MFKIFRNYRKIITVFTVIIIGIIHSGCAKLFIVSPPEDETQITSPYTLQAQKSGKQGCFFREGSFRAILDQGQGNEIEITSLFTRPSNSNLWTASDYNLSEGMHSFYVSAKFDGVYCFNKNVSDRAEFEVLKPLKPDLTIAELSFEPELPFAGNPVVINIIVNNMGETISPATTLSIEYSAFATEVLSVSQLNVGEETNFTFNKTFSNTGINSMTLSVDPDNDIAETNEVNNIKIKMFSVEDVSTLENYYQLWRSWLEIDETSQDPIDNVHLSSNSADYTNHQAFEAIVSVGISALEFVMSKIQEGDYLMNIAASRITGVNPWNGVTVDRNWGTTGIVIGAQQTSQRWLEWWEENKDDPQWQP